MQSLGLEAGGITLGLTVFGLVFVSAVMGLTVQHFLPERYTTGGSRDMSGAVIGLLTLLLALVLGLMIWTAFGVYSTQKASIQQLAINILKVDSALHTYGDEAAPGRTLLRDLARSGVDHVWNAEPDIAMGYAHALSGGQTMQDYLELAAADHGQAEGCESRRRRCGELAVADAAFHGARPQRPTFLSAALRCRRLGHGAVLRLWFPRQGDADRIRDGGGRGARHSLGGLCDKRSLKPLYR